MLLQGKNDKEQQFKVICSKVLESKGACWKNFSYLGVAFEELLKNKQNINLKWMGFLYKYI